MNSMEFWKGSAWLVERKSKKSRKKRIKKNFREKLDNMMYNQVSIKLFLPDKYSVKIVDELNLKLIFSGGHTVKRLAISISVLLLFAFLALDKAVAQQPD